MLDRKEAIMSEEEDKEKEGNIKKALNQYGYTKLNTRWTLKTKTIGKRKGKNKKVWKVNDMSNIYKVMKPNDTLSSILLHQRDSLWTCKS